jgi:hypothetical protein
VTLQKVIETAGNKMDANAVLMVADPLPPYGTWFVAIAAVPKGTIKSRPFCAREQYA